ncbi:Uncharacterized protein PBTT_01440 [Plasmodiophora brassicae]|uniref:Uncharacterized protein n=1 Tax=Plasmodiophora brassicae TaxID=37360 RepID=A0A3P3Y213_PLABS|nr:unnamed protein product [Plasmodiophora brassicae]
MSSASLVDAIVSEAVSRPDRPAAVTDFVGRNTRVRLPRSPRQRQAKLEDDDIDDNELTGKLLTLSLFHHTDNCRDVQFCERTTDINLPGRIPGPFRSVNQPFIFTAVRQPYPREQDARSRQRPSRPVVDPAGRTPRPTWLKEYGLTWEPLSEYTDSFRIDAKQQAASSSMTAPMPGFHPFRYPDQRRHVTFDRFGPRRVSKRIKAP